MSLREALEEVGNLNTEQLADLAESLMPEEAEGEDFLNKVKEAVVRQYENFNGQIEDEAGFTFDIANSAPSDFVKQRWREFVDLGAYNEEPEVTDNWPRNLNEAAGVALYQVAERLVYALL